MKLDLCLPADAGSVFEGKLYIHGGGITRLTPPVLPWTHPQLALIARFSIGRDEFETEHSLTIRLVRPDGELVFEAPASMAVEPPKLLLDGEDTFKMAIVTLGSVVFDQEGVYRFEIDVDGEPVKSMPLPLSVIPQPTTNLAPPRKEGRATD